MTITPDSDGDWFSRNSPAASVENRPAVKQPVKVESSALDVLGGALAPRTVPRTAKNAGKTQDVPGFEGSYASNDSTKGAVMSGAGVTAAVGLGAAAAAPATVAAAKGLGTWITQNPIKSYLAYEAVKDLLPKSIHGLFQAAKKSGE